MKHIPNRSRPVPPTSEKGSRPSARSVSRASRENKLSNLGIAGARGLGVTLARLALRAGLPVTVFNQNVQSLEEAREKLSQARRQADGDREVDSAGPSPHDSLRTTADFA